jgi:putative N6-adenine-specific DNA methylase
MDDEVLKLFAVSAPGMHPFTREELEELGIGSLDGQGQAEEASQAGGVELSGSLADVYAANLQLRTASRLLVRLGTFTAKNFPELRKKAGRLPWEEYLRPGSALALRATSHKSKLYHSGAVAERIAGAIADRLKKAPVLVPFDENAEGSPPQLVVVRLVNDECTVSIDSSGEGLHRRGYRKATAKAPLRETLAAAMLRAGGWDRQSPLIDPFCGSGTIPIEGALWAGGIPPGQYRRFAFMDWPSFQRDAWEAMLARAQTPHVESMPVLKGSDRDAGAVRLAKANAERAGVSQWIELTQRAISAIEAQGVGWIVSNPPYGLRVSEGKDLRNLYAQLGNVLRRECPGWKVVLLSSQDMLLRMTGLHFEYKISTVNGGVNVKLAVGSVN